MPSASVPVHTVPLAASDISGLTCTGGGVLAGGGALVRVASGLPEDPRVEELLEELVDRRGAVTTISSDAAAVGADVDGETRDA